MNRSRTPKTQVAALAVTGALVLASCGGSAEEEAAGTPSPSISPSPSSTVAVPEGVELTEVGADLGFGDAATVIFEPNQKRGSVLELTVESAARGRIQDFSGFIVPEDVRTATPYYVDVQVRNVGEGDVGGAAIPLWGVDGTNTLLQPATFTVPFKRCPSQQLPEEFAAGSRFGTCLVYLAPDRGSLEGVSFRPNQEFDPIQWTGEIATPKPKAKKAAEKGSKRGSQPGSQQGSQQGSQREGEKRRR